MRKFKKNQIGKCSECSNLKILACVTGCGPRGVNPHGFCSDCLAELDIRNAKKSCVTCSVFHIDKSAYDDGQCGDCQKKRGF